MSGKKPHSADSHRSKSSISTVESIGIGSSEASCRLKSILPDGFTNPYDRLYDCVVLLVYCPKHQKVAVVNTRREHIIWAPFIQLREGVSWSQGTLDAIQLTIGRQDSEMNQVEAEKQAPKFKLQCFDVTQIQVPSVNYITRICQLVTLEPSGFKCCTKGQKLDWFPLAELVKPHDDPNKHTNHWGPELRIWAAELHEYLNQKESAKPRKLLHKRAIQYALEFYDTKHAEKAEHKALLGLKFKQEHAVDLYEDYIKHCYPSIYMCFDSFRMYLTKYKFNQSPSNESKIKSQPSKEEDESALKELSLLFKSFHHSKTDYLDFHELFIGLVVMDPSCKDKCEARLRYIFRYYTDGIGHFSEENLHRMVAHMHAHKQTDHSHVLKQFNVTSADQITFAVFYKAIMNNHDIDVSHLLRFARSVLSKASPRFGHKVVPKSSDQLRSSKKVDDHGVECFGCEKKFYDYGMHSVTIDTIGRCIEPNIINEAWLEESVNPDNRQYSVDYVFTYQSIGNVCLDLVKAFHRQKDLPNGPSGMLATSGKEEGKEFVAFLLKLCRHLNGILVNEPKLVKLNGPAIVLGDLQGNLDDLISIEESLFRSFPVNPENVIFLGNYTGEYKYGVECLVYLFAMKILAPSKVFLLRGNAETRIQSGKSLRNECFNKYGRVKGSQAFEAFNDIFSKLPVAAVLDESILCVHSGIPRSGKKISELAQLPNQIMDVHKEAPIVYDILTRFPLSYNHAVGNSKTVANQFMDDRDGDLAFHSAPLSTSLTSIDSLSYSEVVLKSSEIKSEKHSKSNSGHSKSGTGKHSKSESNHHSKSNSDHSKNNAGHHPKSGSGHHSKSNSDHSKSNTAHHSKSGSDLHSKSGSGHHSKSNSDHSKSITAHHSKSGSGHNHKSGHHSKSLTTGHSKSHTKSLTTQQSHSSHNKSKEHHHSHSKSSGHHHNGSHSNSHEKTSSGSSLHKSNSSGSHSKSKSSGSSKTGHPSELDNSQTFDRNSFSEFMELNHLRYLIRGSSVCKTGFKVNFKNRCLSVFSCTNIYDFKNDAAAIVITRRPSQIRFVSLSLPETHVKASSSSSLFHGTH